MKTKLQKTKQYLKIEYNKFKRFTLKYPILIALALLAIFAGGVSFVKILDRTVKTRKMPIEYIVVHYTANLNPGADAEANARYLQKKERAGTHYCVDDKEIIQCTEEHNVAYAVGDRKWNGFVPKFWLKNKIKNNNSLSFEMCLGGGRNDSIIMDITAQSVAWQLVNKGLDISHVVRHHDVTGKHCPKFNYNDKNWDDKKELDSWRRFMGEVRFYWMLQLEKKAMLKMKQNQPNILK